MEPLIPLNYYHIYNHSNGNELLFREYKNYKFFLNKYEMYINSIADTYAYCLMPNHFHLLLSIKDETDIEIFMSNTNSYTKYLSISDLKQKEKLKALFISKQFSKLFSSYTQAYNKVYKRMGSLFMKNFKRKHITEEKYFLRLINYIHFNPVNHGFVSRPEEWRFSSYNTILSGKSNIIKWKEVLECYGDKANFAYCHSKPMEI